MNLFQISAELRSIYDTIEENEGELTPELDEALTISQENFKQKINDYVMLIRDLDGQIDQCSIEAKRIAAVKKSKENLKERLSNKVLDALKEFGDTSKSGSKYLDFATYKVSTRKSTVCEINDDIVDEISQAYKDVVKGYGYNKTFDLGINLADETIKQMNEDPLDAIPVIDKDDLKNLKAKVVFDTNALDLLSPEKAALIKLACEQGTIELSTSKTDCKNAIMKDNNIIAYADIKDNYSLTIK